MMRNTHDDHAQLKDGTALLGRVLSRAFTLQTHSMGAVVIQTSRIISIVFRDDLTGPEDRVVLKDGSQIFGRITDPTVHFDAEGVGRVDLQTASILALQFTFGRGDA